MGNKGKIHLYYGPGKGKTTAAIGTVLRFLGHDRSAVVLQFMKGNQSIGSEYGEITYLNDVESVDIFQYPTRHLTPDMSLTQDEQGRIQTGINKAKDAVSTADTDVVVLDELSLLWAFDICDVKTILNICSAKRERTELLITGRQAPPELVDRADYVTYMAEIKHPYQKDVPPREGVER